MVKRISLALSRARADLAPARGRLGQHEAARRDRQPLARGAPGRPRHPARTAARAGTTRTRTATAHTIDPNVDVLRVDRVRGGRRVPIGAWSTFADHGTVNHSTFTVLQRRPPRLGRPHLRGGVRASGHVPGGQAVVNVYGNSDEGDMSAGLTRSGPAHADEVGRVEARAMLRAWRHAGRAPEPRAAPRLRWTRMCFCGQATAAAGSPTTPSSALPYLTGSEEGRGPLFDATGDIYEGRRLPVARRRPGRQGPGAQRQRPHARADRACRSLASRLGDRLIVTIPGETTSELGRRTRSAVARGHARQRHPSRRRRRLRERVRLLLHDARGVRAPALRGRHHGLRPAPAARS